MLELYLKGGAVVCQQCQSSRKCSSYPLRRNKVGKRLLRWSNMPFSTAETAGGRSKGNCSLHQSPSQPHQREDLSSRSSSSGQRGGPQ